MNITNWGLGEGAKRSGMTMRVLEVPATGAFLLTDGSQVRILTHRDHSFLPIVITNIGSS